MYTFGNSRTHWVSVVLIALPWIRRTPPNTWNWKHNIVILCLTVENKHNIAKRPLPATFRSWHLPTTVPTSNFDHLCLWFEPVSTYGALQMLSVHLLSYCDGLSLAAFINMVKKLHQYHSHYNYDLWQSTAVTTTTACNSATSTTTTATITTSTIMYRVGQKSKPDNFWPTLYMWYPITDTNTTTTNRCHSTLETVQVHFVKKTKKQKFNCNEQFKANDTVHRFLVNIHMKT